MELKEQENIFFYFSVHSRKLHISYAWRYS